MAMEEALRSRLVAALGIPFAWFERPRSVATSITGTLVSAGEEWTHGGPDGLDRPRVRFEAWGATPAAANDAARALKEELQRLEPVTVDGWTFHPASLEFGPRADTDTLDGGAKIFRVIQDFEFYHQPES